MLKTVFDSHGHAVFVVAQGDVVGGFAYGFLCVGHGYTHAGKTYHAEVVVTVAHGYHFFTRQAQTFQQYGQRAGFVDAQRNQFEEVRFGAVNADATLQAQRQFGFGLHQPVGVAHDEALGQWQGSIAQEVVGRAYLHLVKEGFFQHILVVGLFGEDVFVVVGQDGLPVADGGRVEDRQYVVGQQILVEQFARAPVDDFAAVVRQDAAVMLLHLQGFGQRCDAVSGSSGGQHQSDAAFLQAQQCLEVSGGNLFLRVGQCAV